MAKIIEHVSLRLLLGVVLISTSLVYVIFSPQDFTEPVRGWIGMSSAHYNLTDSRNLSQDLPGYRFVLKWTSSVSDITNASDSKLRKKHAVVCMIFTTPGNWETRGLAVRRTWATRCPYPIFFYSGAGVNANHSIRLASNTVALDVPEGRGSLTQKTLAGLRYSFDKYGHVAEWFMKVDDDSYVVWENLESFLNDSKAEYIGRKISNLLPHGYMSGGAGYLISKRAADLLVHKGPTTPNCPQSGAIEDHDIGKCLAQFNIYPSSSNDKDGKLKFHSDNPFRLLNGDPTLRKFYLLKLKGIMFGSLNQDEMLSPQTITLHYVTPGEMFMYDFLLYDLRRTNSPALH